MPNKKLTHIIAVLDRSGSMMNKVEDTVGGFNSFIAEQRKNEGETFVTLAQFDDRYELPYVGLHIDDVPSLRLVPRGSTALYDAIGKTITRTAEKLREMPAKERPGSVVFIIMTDGYENASVEYGLAEVKRLIEKHQKKNWLFQFFGADVSALQVASSIGVPRGQSMYYAHTNTAQAFAAGSRSTSNYVTARTDGASYAVASSIATFTEEERDAAANPKVESKPAVSKVRSRTRP